MFATQTRFVVSRVVTASFLRAAIVAALVIAALPDLASAQKYKSIEPRIEFREARTLRTRVNAALRNPGAYNGGGAADIDKYFKQYYFPQRTQWNPGALAEIGKRREEIVKLLRGTTVPKAQEQLTTLTLGVMSKLARDDFHPAVRYNASLVLGLLDQKYPGSGGNAAAPVVLPAGTNALLELLEAEEFEGVPVHPSVKVGALQGLERHVQFGMDAQYGDRVTKAALGVLNQDPKAMEIDDDVNSWMKCQAARLLARQFKDGPTKEVQDALTALIASEDMGLDDRCLVSGLLDKMTYQAGSDASGAIVPLGNLTKAVVDEGADVAREFQDLILGNSPTTRRSPSFRLGRGEDTGPKLERRQLLSRLIQIDQGAKSLSAGLAEGDKQKLASLTELLAPVIKESKDSKAYDTDLSKNVIELENSVENLVASWQPAAAAPAADDVDFSE